MLLGCGVCLELGVRAQDLPQDSSSQSHLDPWLRATLLSHRIPPAEPSGISMRKQKEIQVRTMHRTAY